MLIDGCSRGFDWFERGAHSDPRTTAHRGRLTRLERPASCGPRTAERAHPPPPRRRTRWFQNSWLCDSRGPARRWWLLCSRRQRGGRGYDRLTGVRSATGKSSVCHGRGFWSLVLDSFVDLNMSLPDIRWSHQNNAKNSDTMMKTIPKTLRQQHDIDYDPTKHSFPLFKSHYQPSSTSISLRQASWRWVLNSHQYPSG